jgi:hypothetical protein
MVDLSDQLVFWAVVLTRFLVPLAIPFYPLPGVVIALVVDAIDQTVFQQFTNLPLGGYQGYDKALDIYYLVIAYISTLRNWTNHFAFRLSRFLLYYRLVGVTLFELVHWRPLMLIFPNTFEYFFIFYEAYRLRWAPSRMTRRLVIGAAAAIWIFIKLPQEYWIHVAQLDTTDFIKTEIFGLPVDATLSQMFQAAPGIFVAAGVLLLLILAGAWWLWTRRLPPADYALAFSAGDPPFAPEQMRRARASESQRLVNGALLEKVFLVSLVSIIFAQVLPEVQATNMQIAIGVAFVITINTVLSHWLARRGTEWVSTLQQFVVMAAVNLGLILVYGFVASRTHGSINLGNASFFASLLTLLVTLFDRYRPVYLARFTEPEGLPAEPAARLGLAGRV